ncbi:MAG TPA: phosphoadenylyl-sulfate reductase [Bryobacteraceae bacterium]|nr:phosphoadenylyl-sulfate reductase [Bryobacteraceae bacterium]
MSLDQKIDSASALIRDVFSGAGGAACVTCSFQTECMALVDLVIAQRPDIPVLFLETGYHFPETYAYRDRMTERMHLNLINLAAKMSVAEQESRFGLLNQTAPDRCCQMRKVEPLFAGLADYGVWFTALRREQSPTRANLKAVDDFKLPSGHQLLKVSPLADWTSADVWAYLKRRGIPALPLYEQGYTSVGCAPCTTPPLDPDNPRSGRWAGHKLECGIHIQAQTQEK